MRALLAVAFVLLLSACVMNAGDVEAIPLQTVDKGERVVTFQADTPYMADLTLALAKQGFQVKPMPTQQYVKETTGDKTTEYHKASTRFGIVLSSKPTTIVCAFTAAKFYDFSLMLIDTQTNQTVLILQQQGPDGPCSSVKPVFDTLADALRKNW